MFYVLGILSAIAFGSTWVLQQHEAAQAPEDLELHPVRLVRRMARRPLWLLGLVLLAVGSALQEATIALSSLSRAESLLILDLVWALVLSRRVSRVRVGRLQWGGAAAVCVGLTVLLLFGDPTTGRGAGPLPRWVAVLAVTAVASAVACVFAVRRRGTARAVALSVTAGLLFGVSDALSKAAFDSPSLLSALSAWQVYACLGTAVIAIGGGRATGRRRGGCAGAPRALPGGVVVAGRGGRRRSGARGRLRAHRPRAGARRGGVAFRPVGPPPPSPAGRTPGRRPVGPGRALVSLVAPAGGRFPAAERLSCPAPCRPSGGASQPVAARGTSAASSSQPVAARGTSAASSSSALLSSSANGHASPSWLRSPTMPTSSESR